MKKTILNLFFIILLVIAGIFMTGCSTSTVTSTRTTDNILVQGSVFLPGTGSGEIVSSRGNLTGKTDFFATVYISRVNNGSYDYSEFSDADVKINSISLSYVNSGLNRFQLQSYLSLTTGDLVTLTITHSKLGTITTSVNVPPYVSDFTITPSLPSSGNINTTPSFTLDWAPISDINGYESRVECYDSSKKYITQIINTNILTSSTFSVIDSNYNIYPFLNIDIRTYNYVSIPGFFANSMLFVSGQYHKEYTNR